MNEVSLKPVIEELENLFSKFNARFFADKLEKPVITVSPDHTRGAYGWCTGWKAWKAGEDEGHYQTLPWNHRGWHAGGAANNTHIGVEMCEPACIKYTGGATFTCSDTATAKAVAKRTYEAAVELFASLCKQYNLDPMKDGVIISHKEGCVRGVASNHGDPEHLWNQLGTGYTMNGFRKAVQAAMKGGGVTTTPSTGNAATGGTGATVKPYLVRVTVSDLYIRKGPGTNYGKNGFIAPGVYTIVAESAGAGATKWGKLKSGAGWISLDYAKTV